MSKIILSEEEINRALTRISYEILEKFDGIDKLVLVGIKTRGIFLASQIQQNIKRLEGDVDCIELDVTHYRDDYVGDKQSVEKVSKQLEGKHVVLVDDVLFTGRTIRASLDAVMDYGRPQSVSLAVLVDRGHRELPIRPDFIGKNIPTSKVESVKVLVNEIDGASQVIIK
ncbi:MAG TPA: bifunctional pyr operon transcriptional regulator/uracil phosphoribosyltransferase PyrR [Erysipelothrix sp.]|nr:bifunctional pyr operon transcriptional regulator/uracil phosphoribosyltransferase PyrR [Erysipelothrix sp.]